MKTVTVEELRDEFPRIEAWMSEGETIAISKRGTVIANLVPAPLSVSSHAKLVKPDIMERLRKTWGNRMFSIAEVEAMRADELAGEEG